MDEAADSLHTLNVAAPQAGTRLDRWLALTLPQYSRARLQALIAQGMVRNALGPALDASRKVAANETYVVEVPAPVATKPLPQDIELVVVYEDEHLIVIDKPRGMVVHPAPGNSTSTLVNALLHHCSETLSGINGVKRPGIVHRLDKDTSGLLVAAKTDLAHHGLAKQFAKHTVERAYRAICWGVPVPLKGQIEGDIGRNPADRKRMAIVSRGGKSALTRYRVDRQFGGVASQIECRLATGRTHQIRVHLASIGHPLIGDKQYGRGRTAPLKSLTEPQRRAIMEFPRQALHAFLLGFEHPATGQRYRFKSNIPNDINTLIGILEGI